MANGASLPSQVDVLIAGAGPAGLSAALHLRTARASVLLVDARRVIGAPLRCAELSRQILWKELGLEPRENWIRWTLKTQGGALVVNRKNMEADLAALAADCGAVVRAATSVTAVGPFDGDGRTVTLLHDGRLTKVRARCVIAADGVASRVARLCGAETNLRLEQLGACLIYRLVEANVKTPWTFQVQYLAHRYPFYFWVIPSGPRQASVGLVLPANQGSQLRRALAKALAACPAISGGHIGETVVGAYPLVPPLERPYADGLIVAGTAARLIDRSIGEGIWPAAWSGRVAAETIAKAPSMKAADLAVYRAQLQPLYNEIEQRWEKGNVS